RAGSGEELPASNHLGASRSNKAARAACRPLRLRAHGAWPSGRGSCCDGRGAETASLLVILRRLVDVEDRAIRIHSANGIVDLVIRLVALGRGNAFEDSGWCARSVATDGEDPRLSVRELGPQDGGAVSSLIRTPNHVVQDRGRALEVGEN